MNNFLNDKHKKLVTSIVENFLNDAKKDQYSKDYLRLSEKEICELIGFTINPVIERMNAPLDENAKIIITQQVALGLYLIGNDLHKRVSQELRNYRNDVRDPLMSFMDDKLFFAHCVDELFGEPINNFLDEKELSLLKRNYYKTAKPKLYDSYLGFEWVTPFHHEHYLEAGQKNLYDFRHYVKYWELNGELNNLVKQYHSENCSGQEECWWLGRFQDFFELDRQVVKYRDAKHDFLKSIFTLEHVFIYGINKIVKIKPEEATDILRETFNSFLSTFVNSFYSEEASLKARKVVEDISAEKLKRMTDWEENKRKIERDEQERSQEVVRRSLQQEENARQSELRFIAMLAKAAIALLLLAVLPMPYGFYKILRICISLFSVYIFSKIGIVFIKQDLSQKIFKSLLVLSAIIFNPVIQIHLEKSVWISINIGFSIVCFYLLRIKKTKK